MLQMAPDKRASIQDFVTSLADFPLLIAVSRHQITSGWPTILEFVGGQPSRGLGVRIWNKPTPRRWALLQRCRKRFLRRLARHQEFDFPLNLRNRDGSEVRFTQL